MIDINKENGKYRKVSVILGDPEKALRKLSWPLMVSTFLITIYSLVDGIWIAGLGTDALAGLGFVSPFFSIIIGLGTGLGAGANSLIARSIGAKDKKTADNAAIHSILISIIISIISTTFLLIFLEDILIMIGAGETIGVALEYAYLIVGGLIIFVIFNIGASIFRSEGDVKRAMYVIAISIVLNMILDPIFIYTLGIGMAGAAWAALLSTFVSCLIMIYWIFIKKDTYLSFGKKNFKYDKEIVKELLNVGLPASAEMILYSIFSIIINYILVIVSGNLAVAIFTAGWRVVSIAFIPHTGLGIAILTVGGGTYGAHRFDKMSIGFNYAVKIGLIISIIISIILFVFASEIAGIFAYTDSNPNLILGLTIFIQIMAIYTLQLPIGVMSSSIFQAIGKGIESFVMAVIRELIATITFIVIFILIFQWAEIAVWWGLAVGGLVGSIIAYIWAKLFIDKLKNTEDNKMTA